MNSQIRTGISLMGSASAREGPSSGLVRHVMDVCWCVSENTFLNPSVPQLISLTVFVYYAAEMELLSSGTDSDGLFVYADTR